MEKALKTFSLSRKSEGNYFPVRKIENSDIDMNIDVKHNSLVCLLLSYKATKTMLRGKLATQRQKAKENKGCL